MTTPQPTQSDLLFATQIRMDCDNQDSCMPIAQALAARDAEWREKCKDAADENVRLRAQLPEGMRDCAIVFKECEKGHGWLTATNWVQQECWVCERDRLRAELAAERELLERYESARRGDAT